MSKNPKHGTSAYELKWLITPFVNDLRAGTNDDEKFKDKLLDIFTRHARQPYSFKTNMAVSIDTSMRVYCRCTEEEQQKICDLVTEVNPDIGFILQKGINERKRGKQKQKN